MSMRICWMGILICCINMVYVAPGWILSSAWAKNEKTSTFDV